MVLLTSHFWTMLVRSQTKEEEKALMLDRTKLLAALDYLGFSAEAYQSIGSEDDLGGHITLYKFLISQILIFYITLAAAYWSSM